MKSIISTCFFLLITLCYAYSQTKTVSYQQTIGSMIYIYYSDGTTATIQKIGNITYFKSSDGISSSSQKIGNTYYINSNDGTTKMYQIIGDAKDSINLENSHNYYNNTDSNANQKFLKYVITGKDVGYVEQANNTSYIYDVNGNYSGYIVESGKASYYYNEKGNYSGSLNTSGNHSYIYDSRGHNIAYINNSKTNSAFISRSYTSLSNYKENGSQLDTNVTKNKSSKITISNKSDKNVHFSYVKYDSISGWESVGWFSITSDSYITINLKNYAGQNLYVYAEYNGGELYWADPDSNHTFCVDTNVYFSIPNSDSKDCEATSFKRVQMYEMKINAGYNYWSFGD